MAIFYMNKSCDEYNNIIVKKLASLYEQQLFRNDGSLIKVQKSSYVYGNGYSNDRTLASEYEKKLYKSFLKSKDSQSLVPFTLLFFIGARVMLLKNMCASKGLVNGRRGIITDILQDENTGKIYGLHVTFDAISTFDEQEELIHMTKVDSFRRSNGTVFNFYQFPLKLCYSVTAHKSQGQTLSKVAICLDEKAFAHGSFYVALSRVRSIDDIIFFGKNFPEKGPDLHTNTFISDFQFKLAHQL